MGVKFFSKDLLAFPPLFSFFEEALDDDVHNLKKLLIMLGDIYMVFECFAQMQFYFFHLPPPNRLLTQNILSIILGVFQVQCFLECLQTR